ncbi:MAG: hypothetical protein OES53_05460 [Xanthomonadales bacterium]|jgi:hypothetical protein|nr:hypothetical protein [Xanthomonadales bacterium]MDH3923514.1 hypothetical protein [Xanthomonadales bacterium]MDH3940054.1 hypothetical protein [Xanthomonadales bacterium]MDH4001868.1 hypothetical protein [Xanthomonadales bacterium]
MGYQPNIPLRVKKNSAGSKGFQQWLNFRGAFLHHAHMFLQCREWRLSE